MFVLLGGVLGHESHQLELFGVSDAPFGAGIAYHVDPKPDSNAVQLSHVFNFLSLEFQIGRCRSRIPSCALALGTKAEPLLLAAQSLPVGRGAKSNQVE